MLSLEDSLKGIEQNEQSDFSVLRLRLGDKPVVIVNYGKEHLASIYLEEKRAELRRYFLDFIREIKEIKDVLDALNAERYSIIVDGNLFEM